MIFEHPLILDWIKQKPWKKFKGSNKKISVPDTWLAILLSKIHLFFYFFKYYINFGWIFILCGDPI